MQRLATARLGNSSPLQVQDLAGALWCRSGGCAAYVQDVTPPAVLAPSHRVAYLYNMRCVATEHVFVAGVYTRL